jgi:nickel superoxide dismutase
MIAKCIKPVYAHCDLPCGIYETQSLRTAAETCLRMVEKIEALGELDDDNVEQMASFVRAVHIKEEHATKLKTEAATIWSDYFKPEHLEKFPELHDTFWQLAKQASVVKQTVSREACELLLEKLAAVEKLFADSKA